ncbi:DUF11 domain-containing protein [Nocardioides marinquilinus]|uniref:DUF11 domain-containing protein n=1 Tax=Nocardioides marinquilinus TaxID=1210400 RepID=A0ABP9Q3L6_9ACTN
MRGTSPLPSHRALKQPHRPPRWLVVVLVGLLAGVVALPVAAPPAQAAVIRPFTKVYSTQTNGSVQLTGNTLMTCSPTGTNGSQCAGTLNGTLDQGNNGLTMVRLDVDNDATTSSSSTANLTLPTGATVLKAYLFWGASASLGTATSTTIKFRTPSAGYQTLTSDVVDKQGTSHYSAYRDVTSLVQNSGTYGAADVVLTDNQSDKYAGWNLVVVVADPNAPLRDLSVFSGYASVASGETANASISGFLTPPSGTVNSRVGMVVYEGDKQLTGDQFTINGTAQTDGSAGSTTNFFASRISSDGVILANRNPAYVNSLGTETKSFTTTSIPNNATSANLSFTSSGDVYFPAALTTQVDLYAPTISGTKTVTNLTRGAGTAQVGDTLRYSLSFTNSGDDNATNSVVRDVLPADVTYVPGSIRVTAGANTGAKTDAAGDDVGEYVAASRTVRVRAGTGASTTAGGTLAKGAVQTVTFDVTVDATGSGTTLTNVGLLDYRAPQIGRDYTYTTGPAETPVAARADLAITKQASPEPVDAGSEITYTLTVTDNGPNPATGTVVSDTLPADTTFVSATVPGGSCTQANGTVTCTLGTVNNGATRAVTVVARVQPGFTGTGVTNVATVTSDVSDPVPGNNAASAASTVTTSADVAVTKVGTPTNPVPGRDVTYTITATNNGPSTARSVVVADTLPTAFLTSPAVTATTPSGTCTVTGRSVSCPVGALAPGASATVTVTARLDPSYAGGAIANTATVSTTTLDRVPGNNSATASNTPGAAQADLSIDKTTTTSPVVPGRPVQYVLTVTNNGPSDAAGVRVTDTPPAALTNVVASPSQGTCTTAVVCTLGAVPAGGSATVVVDAVVAPTATGQLANTASVTATTADPDGANNSDTATDTLQPRADLAVTKTAPPTTSGNPVTYTVTVTNRGPSVAGDVVVTDPVPTPLTLQSASSDRGTCTTTGATVRCAVGSLPVGATTTITIVAGTPADGSGAGAVNTATATTTALDPDTTNNSASHTLTGGAQANLALQKSASPSPVVAGGPITYTLTATNAGPSNATGATITDTVPDSVVIGTLPAGCTRNGQVVTCTRAALNTGDTWTVVLPGTVAPGTASGAIVANTATVAAAGPVDPSPADNTATTRTPVVTRADLQVTKTGPTSVVAGSVVDYTVTVRNLGPSDATDVQVLDDLPGNAAFVSSPTCSSAPATPGTLTCDLGTVPAGQTATATVRVRVDPAVTGGSVVNTARVSSATTDPVVGNNTGQTSATVQTRTDLTVVKSVTPVPLVAGRPAAYDVTVTNNGPSDAAGVRLVDVLPAGVTLTGTSAAGGSCSGTTTVTCTRAVLSAGATWTVRLQVAVAAGATANQVNQASVTSTTTELTPGDNQTSISTPVTAAGDLEVVKTVAPSPLVAGQQVTYTLTVVNYGPADMVATTVTDPLPAALSGVRATVSPTAAGTCSTAGGTLSCNLGTLADGPTPVTITVTGLLDPAFAGASLSNTATVSSTTADLDASNNQSTATSTVQTRADLSVVKSASVDTVVAGVAFDYDLTVTNAGPSVARATVVRDTVPAGLTVVSATVVGGPACAVDGRAVQCALGDLPPGGTPARMTITVLPDADPPSNRLVNQATVGSQTVDPATDDNTSTLGLTVITRADLAITKTRTAPATGPVVPGQRVAWTIAVTNPGGPSTARGVTVTDAVDPRLTGVTATGASGGCTVAADNRVTCSLGSVAVGAAPATVTVSGVVPADFTGNLVNTATVSATTPDPNAANDSATVTETPAARAGVSVTKTRTSGPVVPGRTVTWDVDVTNAGPSVAAAVTLTDDLPDELTNVTATPRGAPAGATCTVGAANVVTCPLGSLAVGTATVTITARVPAYYTGALDNTAVVDSPTDTTPADNTATSTGTAQPSADLAVTKTRTSGPVVPGSAVTWQVTVDNLGPSRATGVVVTDDVLDALTGVVATVPGVPGACTVTAGGATPNLVRCELGAIAPGDPLVTVTITGDLPAGYTGRVDNTAEVTSAVPDPAAGNNSATVDGSAAPRADVSVTKTRTTPVVPGTRLSWTIVVRNAGPSSATNVEVVDELLDALTDVAVDAPASAGCRVGAAGVLRCSLATLGPNQSVSVVVSGRLPAGFTGSAANTVTVDSPVDTTPGNNTATAPGTARPDADVSVTKSRTSGPVVPGRRVTWDVVVTNNGPSVARSVTLTDDLVDALTDITVTPAGLDCTVAAGKVVQCDLGTLAATGTGRSVTVTISGRVPPSYTGALDNTAVVDSPTDTTPGNNTDTSTGSATPDADVSVSKARTSGPVVPGRPISWNVTVTNAGPSVARDVVLTDDLVDALTGLTVSPSTGCTVAAGNQVTCDLGDLPATGAGSSVTLTLSADVPAGYTGALDNTAVVDSPTDTTPGNNTATSAGSAAPDANVSVTKVRTSGPVVPGRPISWNVTVTNAGPSVARSVTLTDDVVDALTGLTVSPSAGCSVAAGNEVTCDLGDLAATGAGASRTITLSADVPAGYTGALDNTAVVDSPTDTTPGNNTDTSTGTAAPDADVSVTKVRTSGPVVPGRPVGWSVTVTNAGPSVARDVVLTDDLVDALTGLTVSPSADCEITAGNRVTCDLGDLPATGAGASRTITLSADVPAGYSGALDNTAVVDSPTDTTPGNNTDTSTGTATPDADVSVGKVRTSGPVVPGRPISWNVTVTNNGPSVARSVTLTDDLVDALTDVTVTPAGLDCTVAAGKVVQCDLGTLAAAGTGRSVTVTISGRVPASYTGALDNTAVVDSPTDTTPGNNTDTSTGGATPDADVSVSKVRTSGPVVPGRPISWNVTVTNAGPSVARDVVLTDDLVDALTGLSVDPSAGCTVTAGNQVTCDLGDLAASGADASRTITLSADVPAGYTGALDNTAVVDSPTDTTPGNNTDTSTGTATPDADVSVSKVRTSGPVVPGRPISWNVTVTNNGPSVARSVTLADDLVDALTDVTVTPAGLDCDVTAGNQVTCDLGDLPATGAGSSVTVTVTGDVPAAYTGALDNTAVVDSPTDTTPGNNSATSTGTAAPEGNVSVSKVRTSGPVVPGRPISWDVTVTNAGPSVARDVVLTDDLVDALTGLSVDPSDDCEITAGNQVTCELGDLPATGAAASRTVTLTAAVPAGYTGDLDNTAVVDSPTDTTPGNNTATSAGTAAPEANVSVSKVRTSGPVVPGRPISWNVTVTNAGPSVARSVTLTDDLVDGLTGLSVAPSDDCEITAGNEVACDLGDLAATDAGATRTFTLSAEVPAGYTGALDNTAVVDSPTDTTPGNNTDTSAGTATPDADVSVSKVRTSGPVVPGRPISWNVTVTNAGPSVARSVTLTDDLVDDLTGLSVAPSDDCEITAGNQVTCDLGDLPATGAGATRTITLSADVPAGYTGALDNTAVVDSPTDTTAGNNSDTSTGTAAPDADVSVSKIRTSGPVVPGRPISWNVTVTNAGPSVARDVVLTDDLVDALTGLTVDPSADCEITAGNQVTCDLGDLPATGAGATRTITLTADVPAGYTGDLDNTAVIDSPTDTSPGNDTDTSPGTAQPSAGVSVSKTRTSGPVVPGTPVTWDVSVTNSGPSVARAVVLTDEVPAALTGVTADLLDGAADACTVTGSSVECVLGDLPATGSGSQVVVRIGGDLPAGFTGDLDNTAVVDSPTDTTPADNTSTSAGTAQPAADVSVTKTRPSGEVVAGTPVTWRVVVTNNGPSVARTVVVADDVEPALTGVTAVTDSGASCTVSARNEIDCALGDLAVGDPVTVTITGGVPPSYTGTLDNTVVVDSPTDTTPSNNTATVPGDASSVADVNIVKARTSGPVVPGRAVTWTLTVGNAGPSTATAVVVDDDLLDALTDVTAEGPAGVDCTIGAGNTVQCELGDIAPGDQVVVTVRGQVPASYTGGAANTATVVTTPPDGNPTDNTSTSDGDAVPEADVSIVKTRTSGAVVPGRPVAWSLQVRNAGPSIATDVVVEDDLPDELTNVDVDAPAGVECSLTAGNAVRCEVGDLASGAAAAVVVTITADVPAGFVGDVDNTATVTSPTDSTPGNNSSTSPGTAEPAADVSIDKVRTVGPVVPGRPVSWDVTVTNGGPSVARDVVVTDDLVDALTGVTVTPAGLGCTVGAGNEVRCELGDLPATGSGSAVTVTITADVPPGYTGDVDNTAVVDSPTDTTPGNNSSTSSGTAQPTADVSISKTRTIGPIVPGRPVSWDVTVTNGGPSVARDVVVTDDLVDTLTDVTVTPAGLGCAVGAGNEVRCELGDLPASGAGSTVTVTITADVPPGYTGALDNTAVVDSPTDTTDDNNEATSPGTAQPAADVSISKTRTIGPVVPGRPVSWDVTVVNGGPSVARDVVVTDNLVDTLTGVTVTPAGLGCTVGAGNEVRCELGDLPATGAGSTVTISITADVPPGYTGALDNTAVVDSPTDTSPDNNSSTSAGTAQPAADVSVSKTRTSGPVVPGRPVSWDVVVTNGGPSVARDVVLTDDLVDALTGVTVTPTGLGCTVGTGNEVRCELGDLPASGAGSAVTVTITADVPPGYTGALDNTATVDSPTDTSPGNNSSTSPGTAEPAADVSITKTRTSGQVVPGGPVSWDVVVANGGPSVARDVVVTDDLVDALTGVTVNPTGLGCTVGTGNEVRCELGDLAATGAGSTVTITITADVPAGFTGALDNTAVVDSPADTTDDNNEATSPGTAQPAADVSIDKTRTSGQIVPGRPVSWDVVVTNGGPSVARDVVVTDDLVDTLTSVTVTPAGLGCTVGADNEVRCELGDLPASGAGSTVTVTITADVPPGYTGALDNTAVVDSPTDTTDDNNEATSPGTAQPAADVSVSKTRTSGAVVPGTPVAWEVVVTNGGPSVARDVVLTDDLVDALTDVEVTPASLGCTVGTVGTGNEVRCELGDLPASGAGSTVTLTVSAQVPADYTGDLDNTAVVTSPTDTTPGNNNSTSPGTAQPAADVSISKTRTSGQVVPGSPVSWDVVVANGGPSVARDVVVTDDLVDTLTGVTVTPAGLGCTVDAGNVVRCELGDLAATGAGATVTVTIAADVPAGYTGRLDNTAGVTSPTDTTDGNNTSTSPGAAQPAADVSISKTRTSGQVVPGTPVSWDVVVTNGGPSVARDVVVTDDLVNTLTGVTVTPAGLGCTVGTGNEVRCELGDLPATGAGATVTISITADVPPGYTGALDNTAVVDSPTDTSPGNNSSTSAGTAQPTADVSVTKTRTSGRIVPGGPVSWDVVVTNGGPSVARDVVLVDDVVDDLTGVTVVPAGLPCTVGDGNVVRCDLGDLPASGAGSTVTVTVTAAVPADYTGDLDNTAVVSSPTDTTTPGNDTSTSPGTASPDADVSVTKTRTSGPVVPGRPVSWSVVVTNAGPSVARDVVLTDDLVDALTGVEVTPASLGCTVTAGNLVRCELGDLAASGAGSTVTLTVSAQVPADYEGDLDNTVEVDSPTDTTTPGNDTATSPGTAQGEADVSITKTRTSGPVVAGSTVSWDVVVTNAGPSTARDVVVTDDLVDELTGVVVTPAGCSVAAGNVVRCALGDLAASGPGSSATVTITAQVPGDYAGPLDNTAEVSSPTDTTPGNDTATSPGNAEGIADLSVTKTLRGTAVPGRRVTWDVVVANAGPSVARDVIVTDRVPDVVDDVRATGPTGTTCEVTGGLVTCTTAVLRPGETVALTVSGRLAPGATGELVNTASVAGAQSDPTPADNTDTSTEPLAPSADLAVTKAVTPAAPLQGGRVTFTLTVRNLGPSTATGATLRDPMPRGVRDTEVVADGGSRCEVTAAGGRDVVACDLPAIAPGARVVVRVSGRVAEGLEGTLSNTVVVAAGDQPDPVTGNNTDTVTTGPVEGADVGVVKTALAETVDAGEQVGYRIVVTNEGPATARDVELVDRLPEGLTVAATEVRPPATGRSCAAEDDDTVLRCALGDVAAGDAVTVVLTADVGTEVAGRVVNGVEVTAATGDPTLDDNTDEATVVVVGVADEGDTDDPDGPDGPDDGGTGTPGDDGGDDTDDGGLPGTGAGPWLLPMLLAALGSLAAGLLLMRRSRRS